MTAPALWVLLGLFLLRVVGQALLGLGVLRAGGRLPPWDEWYSGLLPYPWLLLSQVAILALLVKVSFDVTRGDGYFARPNRRLGRALLAFGMLYALGMVVRYLLRGSLSIPIVFHWVLAGYLLILGVYHLREAAAWYPARSPQPPRNPWS